MLPARKRNKGINTTHLELSDAVSEQYAVPDDGGRLPLRLFAAVVSEQHYNYAFIAKNYQRKFKSNIPLLRLITVHKLASMHCTSVSEIFYHVIQTVRIS